MPKKTKKVLFTSHTANFQKFNHLFMDWFREQGYEVHYASMGEEDITHADRSFTVPFSRNPLKLTNIVAYRALKKIIDEQNYDIIHTHTPMGSVVTRLAAKSARKNGTKVLYTAHGFHFFKGAPLLNWLVYYTAEKIMAKHADLLITINKEDFARAKKKLNTKVAYIPGVGISSSRFEPYMTKSQQKKMRADLGLTQDNFVMVFPAELNKNKNQEMLILAMQEITKKHPEAVLLLPGGDSLHGFHKNLIQNLGLEKNIHLLGYRGDIPQLMQIADLSVSSSYREGLPVNIMEAMFLGLPVVATNCRGNRDLIQHGKNGFLVQPNDAQDFSRSVIEVCENKKLAKKMGDAGKNIAKKYSAESILLEQSKLYTTFTKKNVLHLLASNLYSGAENIACKIIDVTRGEYTHYYGSPQGPIVSVLDKKNITHVSVEKMSKRNIANIIKEKSIDVIHAHDFRASIAAARFSKKVSVISHIHQSPEWSRRKNIKSILYRHFSKKFSKILIVSEAMKNNYVFQKNTAHVMALRNFVDAKNIKEQSNVSMKESYDVLFCGRLEPVKQPLVFLSLVEKIKQKKPDISAVLVGDGSLSEECRDFIKKNNLENNVKMVGFQTNPYQYMGAAKVLVITSTDEGFGLVAIEAVISGCVVVSKDLPSITELFSATKKPPVFKNQKALLAELTLFITNEKAYRTTQNDQYTAIISSISDIDAFHEGIKKAYGDLC